jgi:hypothetical protein
MGSRFSERNKRRDFFYLLKTTTWQTKMILGFSYKDSTSSVYDVALSLQYKIKQI